MDLLKSPPPLDLNDRSWIIHTRSEERPPVMIHDGAVIKDSLITDGCVVMPGARVEKSVLSPGVFVSSKAVVRQSIILSGAMIEPGARIERSIVDKNVQVGRGARIGRMPKADEKLGITTVGKNARIPDKTVIAPGAVVDADAKPEYFTNAD